MTLSRPRGLFAGLCTLDVEYLVEAFPGPDDKVIATEQLLAAGGPATNAAKTFAVLGGAAVLGTAVGDRDGLGTLLLDLVRKWSVDVIELTAGGESVPLSSVLVSGRSGERAVVSINATRASVSAASVDKLPVTDCATLLVDGHHMDLALVAAQRARGAGVQVVFDGGSWKAGTERLLPFVDWAICSARFAPPGTAADPDAILTYLQGAGVRGAAVTLGRDGARYATDGTRGSIEPRPVATVVDTLGAGDVFHGATCYYLATGASFVSALDSAAQHAGASCGYLGVDGWLQQQQRAA